MGLCFPWARALTVVRHLSKCAFVLRQMKGKQILFLTILFLVQENFLPDTKWWANVIITLCSTTVETITAGKLCELELVVFQYQDLSTSVFRHIFFKITWNVFTETLISRLKSLTAILSIRDKNRKFCTERYDVLLDLRASWGTGVVAEVLTLGKQEHNTYFCWTGPSYISIISGSDSDNSVSRCSCAVFRVLFFFL